MDPYRALLSCITFLLYVAGPVSCYRLCGPALADALAVVCKGRGYYIHESQIAQKDSPILSHHVAASFLGSSSGSTHSRQRRRVRTGQIVNECCDNECSNTIMESYCNKRTPDVPQESVISSNTPEERTEDSTLQTNDESTERRTDGANDATNLEAPNPDAVDTSDATAASDVEQSPPEDTTTVEKPKKGGKGKSSLESSTKKNRTSKGMSKEERRRIASEERRASRERKKELSRERRRRLKLQQRKDKKKKKRLESAERNRGTDHMALSEDSTLMAREPLGIDVRKRFHHPPRSSREQLSTATHTLNDDPSTSRQDRRRVQSRQSSRERKLHKTTASAATVLDDTRRERRNVFQRIADIFL